MRPWPRLRAARDETGALLGYMPFWHIVDELHLLNVAVAISARRRGIGRALMGDLVAYARQHEVVRTPRGPGGRSIRDLRCERRLVRDHGVKSHVPPLLLLAPFPHVPFSEPSASFVSLAFPLSAPSFQSQSSVLLEGWQLIEPLA